MSGPFVKLFGSILNSSIWCADAPTRLVWITLLLLADGEGKVWGAVPGIARQAGVSVDACRQALEFLSAPDPDSRTPDEGGRRILEIEGGWRIVNHRKYREMQTTGQRSASERSRRYRAKRRDVTQRDGRDASRLSRTEGEVEVEVEVTPCSPPAGDGAAASSMDRRRVARKTRTASERDRLLADGPTHETATDWVERLGGDLGVGLLRAARRARGDGGYSRETCRHAIEAVADALAHPEHFDERSTARWCSDHNRSATYVLRPGVVEKLAADWKPPGNDHHSSPGEEELDEQDLVDREELLAASRRAS